MEVRNCKGCGRLFNVINREVICPDCVRKLEDKAKLKEEYDIESADSFDNPEAYDVISAAKDVFFAADDNDIMDIQGDDIKKFFEDEAVDAFVNSHMDSYEYNGVSPSDFQ